MLRDLRDYMVALMREWVTWMSGIMGILAWAVGAWWPNVPGRPVFGVAAVLSFAIGGFLVWRQARGAASALDRARLRMLQDAIASWSAPQADALYAWIVSGDHESGAAPAAVPTLPDPIMSVASPERRYIAGTFVPVLETWAKARSR